MRHEALSLNFSTAKKKKNRLGSTHLPSHHLGGLAEIPVPQKKLRKRSNGAHGRRI
jgi:hypothetical protein